MLNLMLQPSIQVIHLEFSLCQANQVCQLLIHGELLFLVNQMSSLLLNPSLLGVWVLQVIKVLCQDRCQRVRILVGGKCLQILAWVGEDNYLQVQT